MLAQRVVPRTAAATLLATLLLFLWLGNEAQARDTDPGVGLPGLASDSTPVPILDLPGVSLGSANVVLASGAAPVSVVATTSSGAQVLVNAPVGALSEGSTLQAAPIVSEAALEQAAPPSAGMSIIVGFQINARTSSGAAITGNLAPVKAVFTLQASSHPPGTKGGDLILAFWTGTTWTTLPATVAVNVNLNGSTTLTTNLPQFAIFSIQSRVASTFSGGTIAASGVSIVSFTGTTAQLDTAGAAAKVVSVTATVGGKMLTFVVGAPDFVNAEFNAAFTSGLNGTLVIVKA